MKGKIKLLSLLLALAMVASLFVACDEAPAAGGDDGDQGDEVVAINWWHWGGEPNDADRVIAGLNEKSAEDIGVTVDFIWNATADAATTALATGEKGDVVFTCSWWCNYLVTAQKGQLADISEEVKKHDDLMELVPDWAWEAVTVNGKIYAVPVMKDSAAQQFWLINKQYVQDGAGVTDAELDTMGKRLSTVTPILRKVKAYADAGNPYPNELTAAFNFNKAGVNGMFNGWDTFGANSLGDDQDKEGVKVEWQYDNAECITDLKEVAIWYADGLVNQDCAQTESEPSNYIVATAQGWEGAELSSWGVGKDYDVVIRKRNKAFANRASVLGSCNGVFANSENVEASVKYLAYCSTNAEYRNMLAYGLEGEDWKALEDGTVEKLKNDWAPGSFSQACTWIMKPVSPAPATMYKDIEAMSKAASGSELMGFTFDISSIENEVAAVDAVMTTYSNGLMCGTYADVDATIAKMKAECEAAGLTKVIEAAEEQVAAYLG